jgi:hypothetical protein
MNRNIFSLFTLLIIMTLMLASCGPSQDEIEATATQQAANDHATQTANAPTATLTSTLTPTPTETPTPTPTFTPSPSPTRTLTPTDTPVPTLAPPVEMEPFVSFSSGLTYELEFPRGWEHEVNKIGGGEFMSMAIAPDQTAVLEIYFGELDSLDFGETSLDEYVEIDLAYLLEVIPDFDIVSQERTETTSGLPIEIIVYTQQDGSVTSKRLIHVHDDTRAIVLTYYTLTNSYKELLPIFDYTFSGFDISE